MMLVHAHPDDETIGTGATMAKYVAEGTEVSLVTCTLGEEGEVLVPELEHLGAERDDKLGPHRLGELHAAMAALGMTDYQRLGGDFHFRDSGMAYDENHQAIARKDNREGCFWLTDVLEAADVLVPIIREKRPQVLITYDQWGGYGHPDHIQAHRVAMYAYVLAGAPSYRADLGESWAVPRVLWTAMSESWLREGIRQLRAAGDTESWAGMDPDKDDMPPMMVSDEHIVAEVDGTDYVAQKVAAMRAYPTQISFDGPFFKMIDSIGEHAWAREHFRIAAGIPFPDTNGAWATDLFAGLE